MSREDITSTAAINLTAMFDIIKHLSPEDREVLFRNTGIEDESELELLLNPEQDHTNDYEKPFLQYTEYRINSALMLYVPPILIILGTFGNLFSFIVFCRKPMVKVASSLYLACLAIADSLVLYVGMLTVWIAELTKFTLKNQANWICKLITVSGHTFDYVSSWLLVAVMFYGFIAVCYQKKSRVNCSISRTLMIILFLICLMLAISLHFVWTVEIEEFTFNDGKTTRYCDAVVKYAFLVHDVWPWVDITMYALLPYAIILLLNIIIIYKMLKVRRRRKMIRSTLEEQELGSKKKTNNPGTQCIVMILAVSFTFVILTLPMSVCHIVTIFWKGIGDVHAVVQLNLVTTVTMLLMYANHSFRFFVYCAAGRKFRLALKRMFHRGDTTSTNDDIPDTLEPNENEWLVNDKEKKDIITKL